MIPKPKQTAEKQFIYDSWLTDEMFLLFYTIVNRKGKNEDCKWLLAEVCTNADCDCCADFPDKEYCLRCRFWECEDETLGEHSED